MIVLPLLDKGQTEHYNDVKSVQWESNTRRISAELFGPFGLIVLALREQGGVLCGENASDISRRNVLCSFFGADFRPGKALTAENP